MQTCLGDWEVVEEQIQRSKIKRYPYKKLLGVSLTRFILSCKANELSSHQTISQILSQPLIRAYLFENPEEHNNFLKNIQISVSARYSEENSRGR